MADLVGVTFDLFTVVSGLGLTYIGYRLWRLYKGGDLESPFKILTPTALIFAIAKFLNIVVETTGGDVFFRILQIILEAFFVTLIFYIYNLYYEAWKKLSPASQAPAQK